MRGRLLWHARRTAACPDHNSPPTALVPAGSAILGSGLGKDSQILSGGEQKRGFVWAAFEERGFHSVIAHAQLENTASVHVLEKLGFQRTGPVICDDLAAEGFVIGASAAWRT